MWSREKLAGSLCIGGSRRLETKDGADQKLITHGLVRHDLPTRTPKILGCCHDDKPGTLMIGWRKTDYILNSCYHHACYGQFTSSK